MINFWILDTVLLLNDLSNAIGNSQAPTLLLKQGREDLKKNCKKIKTTYCGDKNI